MDLTERFFAYHAKTDLIQKGDRILVALSGGKDSVCLLLLMKEAEKRLSVQIGACHIDHMIRGAEAKADLVFCQKLCEKYAVPFFSEEVDVPRFCRENGVGIEEGARTERYRLLEEVARREGYGKIATAHTASDQAETVLFHLVRGCGMAGAAGMPEKRGMLIRPLLPFFKEEILAYLEEIQAPFTQDSTNGDILYARNRLRARVLPELTAINPGVEAALVRFGAMARGSAALCRALCDKTEKEEGISFSDGEAPLSLLAPLAKSEEGLPVLYEILSRMASKENISIDFDRFQSVAALLKRPREGKLIEISAQYVFTLRNGILSFCKHEAPAPGIRFKQVLKEGENALCALGQTLTVSPKKAEKVVNVHKNLLIIRLASDRIKGELVARSIRAGDTIRMYGMTKSVKKMLCDAGVPRELRGRLPVVCDEEEILWLPLFGLCDKARDAGSEEAVTLTLSGDDPDRIAEAIRLKSEKRRSR